MIGDPAEISSEAPNHPRIIAVRILGLQHSSTSYVVSKRESEERIENSNRVTRELVVLVSSPKVLLDRPGH